MYSKLAIPNYINYIYFKLSVLKYLISIANNNLSYLLLLLFNNNKSFDTGISSGS